MSILKYCKPANSNLPDPSGRLLFRIPLQAIATANSELKQLEKELEKECTTKKRCL